MEANYYRILDYALYGPCNIWFMFSEDFNLLEKPHNLTKEQLIECLYYLLQNNFIQTFVPIDLEDLRSCDSATNPKIKNVTKETLKRAVFSNGEAENFDFLLTHKGQKAWQIFYKPNWGNYYCIDRYGKYFLRVYALNKVLLKEIHDHICDINRQQLNYPQEQIISSWSITYWKTFDTAYTITYKTCFKLDLRLRKKWRKD